MGEQATSFSMSFFARKFKEAAKAAERGIKAYIFEARGKLILRY